MFQWTDALCSYFRVYTVTVLKASKAHGYAKPSFPSLLSLKTSDINHLFHGKKISRDNEFHESCELSQMPQFTCLQILQKDREYSQSSDALESQHITKSLLTNTLTQRLPRLGGRMTQPLCEQVCGLGCEFWGHCSQVVSIRGSLCTWSGEPLCGHPFLPVAWGQPQSSHDLT